MTTSSEKNTAVDPRPGGEHWNELTATLSPKSQAAFDRWLSRQLKGLERDLDSYVTPNSLSKSQRR